MSQNIPSLYLVCYKSSRCFVFVFLLCIISQLLRNKPALTATLTLGVRGNGLGLGFGLWVRFRVRGQGSVLGLGLGVRVWGVG